VKEEWKTRQHATSNGFGDSVGQTVTVNLPELAKPTFLVVIN